MVGHKLGEFAPTRLFKGHTTKAEKAAQVAAAAAARRPSGPSAGAGAGAGGGAARRRPKAVRREHGVRDHQVHPHVGPEGRTRARSDSRARRGAGAGHAPVLAQAHRARHRETAAVGDGQRAADARVWRRRRPAVRRHVLRRSGAEHEADSPGSDGPRVSRGEADGAPHGGGRRAAGEGGAAAARSAARQSGGRRRRARESEHEVEGGDERNGSEGTSVRVPARVQQDLAVAVVRRQGLREAAARGHQAARRAEDAVRARRACRGSRSSGPPTS